MPIYEYACEKCEREFEVEQRITEDPLKSCPHCRSRKVKRLISQTSFVLKGSGWYSDLYSSSKDAPKEAAADSKKDAAKSGDSAKDAGKPASDGGSDAGKKKGGTPKGKSKGAKAAA